MNDFVLGRSFRKLRELTCRWAEGDTWIYVLSCFIVLCSFLLWYDFSAPPISSNIGFNLFPLRHLAFSLSPFSPYYWPGSFIPKSFGAPDALYYGLFYWSGGSNYSIGLFGSVVVLDALGALCLTYLLFRWLDQLSFHHAYALFGVLLYSFNAYKLLSGYGTYGGTFSDGPFAAGDPALLLILIFLTFLVFYRSPRYCLLLGFATFFIFSAYPFGTLILGIEYIAVVLVFVLYRLFEYRQRGRFKIWSVLSRAGLLLTAVFLSNAYLLYPLVITSGTYTGALSSSHPSYAFSFAFDQIEVGINSIRMITNWSLNTSFAPTWYASYAGSPWVQGLLFGVPLLSLSSIIFIRRPFERLIYGLTVVLILLSTASNPPLGPVFIWVIEHVSLLRPFYNGENFSPLLLIGYCLLSTIALAHLTGRLQRLVYRKEKPLPKTPGRARKAQMRRSVALLVCSVLVAILLVLVPVYPGLSAAYMSGNPTTPARSTLPADYEAANHFLEQNDPGAPVMVFPGVGQFASYALNNETWYNGIDIYPDVIANPSISSPYPPDYIGGSPYYPIPQYIYSTGRNVCSNCSSHPTGPGFIPNPATYGTNGTPNLATESPRRLGWNATTQFGDSYSFVNASGSSQLEFAINTSHFYPNGHWLTGSFPTAQNLSAYRYAIISYRIQNINLSHLQFGFHSVAFASGNGYILSQFTTLENGDNLTTMIPLNQPSISTGGNLSHVVDIFFVYEPTGPLPQPATLWIDNVSLAIGSMSTITRWSADSAIDNATLTRTTQGSVLTFNIAASYYIPNGHWLTGSFPYPENLSSFHFVVISYSTSEINPSYLQFGFHSVASARGNGYILSQFTTFKNGHNLTTVIPLDQPSINVGGNLSHVVDLYFVYTPPSASESVATLRVSNVTLVAGDRTGALVLAQDLARLGVKFAYVDTSAAQPIVSAHDGEFYNRMFGSSKYFVQVFHSRSITIYSDTLFAGLFGVATAIDSIRSGCVTVDGQPFPQYSAFAQPTNLSTVFVINSTVSLPAAQSSPLILTMESSSPTSFRVRVQSPASFILVFHEAFGKSWVASLTAGGGSLPHLQVDGAVNGWLIPRGNFTVRIGFEGAREYSAIQLIAFSVPFVLAALFGFLELSAIGVGSFRRKKQ